MQNCDGYEKSHIAVGPWGGQCGARWNDGVYCTVKQVIISHGNAIESLLTEYDTKGCSVWSEKHGGNGRARTDKIKLDYPDEHLISISGYCGSIFEGDPVVVRSLVLESNRKRYGPFGIQQGTQFTFPVTGVKVVGFYGRSSCYLDAIGVYLKPLFQRNMSNNRPHVASPNCLNNLPSDMFKGCSDVLVAVRDRTGNNTFASTYQFDSMDKMFITAEAEKASTNRRQAAIDQRDQDYTQARSRVFKDVETNDKVFATAEAIRSY